MALRTSRVRSLNNALALASQVVETPNNLPGRSGWAPSVSIQGKLHHLVGPLEPDVDEHGNVETRKWAQLYVHDPAADDAEAAELDARSASLKLGRGTSVAERQRVLSLLAALQSTMHDENTYVQDFMMAGELFASDGVDEAELVISRDERPTDAHARQYDPASGAPRTFQEVTVLVGEGHVKSGCIQLRQRGGGAWRIDHNNRAFDPLHFVLLFPHGEDGWHWYMERAVPAPAAPAAAVAPGSSAAHAAGFVDADAEEPSPSEPNDDADGGASEWSAASGCEGEPCGHGDDYCDACCAKWDASGDVDEPPPLGDATPR